MSYIPTIGLEVHAELKTKSKMFCGCKNEPHATEPNSNICPVCLAHPGTLPVANEQAIEMVLKFGCAVNANIATYSEFDRKNYFYPDIPKAYQISQYAYPFLAGGELEGVQLTRVHLEEDTARSQHDKGEGSLVDFNRSGVPLMELVTEPVIHDSMTAGRFARELQLLLRTLDISDANMEKGEMRVEANISVSKKAGQLGTKVEVKNLNSFRSVELAIDYEINRQIELIENGEAVRQETRGWDENKLRTFTQRSKETAKDYRYFPDPDIPKMMIQKHKAFDKARINEKIGILPNKKRELYENLGITRDMIEVIIADKLMDKYFEKAIELVKDRNNQVEILRSLANYLTSDLTALIDDDIYRLDHLKIEYLVELMEMLVDSKIGSRVAKDLLPALFSSEKGPMEIATENNLLQVSDSESLIGVVDEIFVEFEDVVSEFKSGKEASLQFLIGQGMKKTKGAANPTILKEIIIAKANK